MAEEKRDSRGGSFEIKNGKRVRSVEGTQNHKDGNRARTNDGTPIGTDGKPAKPAAASAADQNNK